MKCTAFLPSANASPVGAAPSGEPSADNEENRMNETHDRYENPLCTRYASAEMQQIFSDNRKFGTWRRLWVALAKAEKTLGLPITQEQIDELSAHVDDIDYDKAHAYEAEVRHDVMAHVRTYADACPAAGGIIHLGATSCYVGDNTDIILMRDALREIRRKLLCAIEKTAEFAQRYADVPTLAYTHFQAAQPTTAGKRATLWLQDLLSDLDQIEFQMSRLRLLGCKGTTGTSASFLTLFDGDADKVRRLEQLIAQDMGFDACVVVSGQTYSRKTDYYVISALSGLAQTLYKSAEDLRLLAHLKEFDEPFESGQIGSSAMAYKRNPMRCERVCALCRFVMADAVNPAFTAATQWLERTLDDSANRRLSIPQAFLAADAALVLWINIITGGRLYPEMMRRHLEEEIPFLATENILMYCTRRGGDRQVLHEAIRRHSVAAAHEVKTYGRRNDLLDRIAADPLFGLSAEELSALTDPHTFIGCAPQQTRDFLREYVEPLLRENPDAGDLSVTVSV